MVYMSTYSKRASEVHLFLMRPSFACAEWQRQAHRRDKQRRRQAPAPPSASHDTREGCGGRSPKAGKDQAPGREAQEVRGILYVHVHVYVRCAIWAVRQCSRVFVHLGVLRLRICLRTVCVVHV